MISMVKAKVVLFVKWPHLSNSPRKLFTTIELIVADDDKKMLVAAKGSKILPSSDNKCLGHFLVIFLLFRMATRKDKLTKMVLD